MPPLACRVGLQVDSLITNPVVRMHILDPASGTYMRNLVVPGMEVDPSSQAYVSAGASAALL